MGLPCPFNFCGFLEQMKIKFSLREGLLLALPLVVFSGLGLRGVTSEKLSVTAKTLAGATAGGL